MPMTSLSLKKVNTDGTVTYTMWVSKEGIVEGKSADDVNSDVSSKAQESDPNAHSYVLSEQTATGNGFFHIVAPILGLVSLILFF